MSILYEHFSLSMFFRQKKSRIHIDIDEIVMIMISYNIFHLIFFTSSVCVGVCVYESSKDPK
jgi:hypothetical protein